MALAATALLASACSKDNVGGTDNGIYYVRFYQDGVKTELKAEVTAGSEKDEDGEVLVIVGSESETHGIMLSIASGTDITTGTYVNRDYENRQDEDEYVWIYYSRQDKNYHNMLFGTGQVTLTSINDNEVKGTFSGELQLDGETKVITKGEFYAPTTLSDSEPNGAVHRASPTHLELIQKQKEALLLRK